VHVLTAAVVAQRKEEEMLKDLEMMQRENSQLVQPQLKRLNEEIADGKEECGRYDAAAAKLAEASAEIQSKVEALEKETKDAEEEKALLVVELAKLRGDPARLKYAPLLGSGHVVPAAVSPRLLLSVCSKQADSVKGAVDTLNAEAKRLLGVIHECDATLAHQRVKRQEADDVQRQLAQKLDKHVRRWCVCVAACSHLRLTAVAPFASSVTTLNSANAMWML